MADIMDSLPDDSLFRLAEIENDLKEIKETLEFVKATIVKADTTITNVADQVMPTVNDLMKSPLLKMLGMKK
jgi:hypothetical protein